MRISQLLTSILLMLGLCFSNENFGQKKSIDSLQNSIEKGTASQKLNALIELSKKYHNNDSLAYQATVEEIKNFNFSTLEKSRYIKEIRSLSKYFQSKFELAPLVSIVQNELKKARIKEDSLRLAVLHEIVSSPFYFLNEFDSCLYHLNRASYFYEALKDTSKLGLINLRKSGIFNNTGEYKKAVDFAFKAVLLHKLIKDTAQLAISHLNLGNVLLLLKEQESARKNYEISAQLFKIDGNEFGYSESINNLGMIETNEENYPEAIALHRKALAFFTDSDYLREIGVAYEGLADAYSKMGKFDSSNFYADKAFSKFEQTHYLIGQAEILYLRSMNQFKESNYSQSITSAQKGLSVAREIGMEVIIEKITKHLSVIHERLGNEELALKYLKLHDSLTSTSTFDKDRLQISAARHQLKLEETELQLKLLKEKNKINLEKSKTQETYIKLITIAGGILLLLLIFAIFVINRNNKLTRSLEEKTEIISSELLIKQSLLSEIHHRVKNNLQIISSMLSLQANYLQDEKMEAIMAECRGRIMSMSLIHESLYKKIDQNESLFSTYVNELIPLLIDTYQVDQNKIDLLIDVGNFTLSMDDSVPCGLMINEIVTNALKHAFPDNKKGEISLKMKKTKSTYQLSISDNGVGFPNQKLPKADETFGFLLIDTLANQLEASIDIKNGNGVSYFIEWPVKSEEV